MRGNEKAFYRMLHSVISPQDFEEKSGHSDGFCLGEVIFQRAWGERDLGTNLNFQISTWKEV